MLREAPAPLSLPAVVDADDLLVMLAEWAIRHAVTSKLTCPPIKEGGLIIRPPIVHSGATLPAMVIGIRPQPVEDVITHTQHLVAWLLAHADQIAARDDAAEWHDDVVDSVQHLAGRWPVVDRPRPLPVPCPSCDLLSLHLHPPLLAPHYRADGGVSAQDHQVICHTDWCGRVLTEGDYWLRVGVLVSERTGRSRPPRLA